MLKTTIVIPTYNERENIGVLIKEIFRLLPDISILIVDDSSPDGTSQFIRELRRQYRALHLITNPKKGGLGRAYIAGFKQVIADPSIKIVVMMDGDLSHQPKYLPDLIKAVENNFDLVIGSRYVRGGGITKKWALWRKILSRLASVYCRLILKYPIKDWTGGFNAMKGDILRKIDLERLQFNGYAFILALKFHILAKGASFKEVPIFFESRKGGESKISRFIVKEGIMVPWKLKIGNSI